MFAKHCASSVCQFVEEGYKDMPITSHLAPLFFKPSNIHLNKVLSNPFEICTITFMVSLTDFTASYPALISVAKLPMFAEARPSSHNIPSLVSFPTCTHDGTMPLLCKVSITSLV